MFTSEEPTRFGLSCSGSRSMAGVLSAEALEGKRDAQGLHFLQVSGVSLVLGRGCLERNRVCTCGVLTYGVWVLEGRARGTRRGCACCR